MSEKKVNPRKLELIQLSILMREKKNMGVHNAKSLDEALYWSSIRINDLILELYYEQAGTDDFRTFTDWHESGFKIKRCEKGWIIWAKKRETEKKEQSENGEGIESKYKFFPTCYLFNVNQVEQITL